VREAFERGVRALIGRIGRWLPEDRRHLAASLLAEMAGAVTLSRAMSDEAAAEELLGDARQNLKTRMGIAP
jgi:TetR/AcrR family transcriptional repressor of nem operon